ncbi:hypothetical protein [Variovorax sp. RA8]|uniref:hypothetical protein n=1 Tax=Variovorax sp. (strain JCM 16519 / RA8) TaxID=662548 RepID=UPI000A759518|nr:hypothetical protein [Variovorax sp. RA8]VTU15369.1 hypothetical protein RA8CHR_00954 [Variovorax sp. RA8]
MKTPLAVSVLALGCALLTGCNAQPGILYTSHGADFDVMSLTDTQGDCEGLARIAYLTWWGTETLKGCWMRERGEIVGRFPGVEDRRLPVGEFQRTELAEYRGATLN